MARLLFRDSRGNEGSVEVLPGEPVYVGRSLDCAIRSDDGMLSRRHARIRVENGRPVLEDLDSANGSHVNNRRVRAKQPLAHADVIQCGTLLIRVLDFDACGIPVDDVLLN